MTTKTKTDLIPAVCYVRMSSDKQEDSPDQQRHELQKLAKAHGYEIIREYFDSGRSGTETKARADFLRMMRDVQAGPDFQFILVWDQDRFSRGDAVEANHWWYLLREAGVQIHSVAQGIIKTDELGSWLTASVTQHGKRQYVVDLSRNVLRGTLKVAREGRPCGKLPYGFMQVVTDGEQTIKLKRNARTRKPKGWASRMVPSDDQNEVDTVREIFETFANTHSSLRSIAVELNRRGVPSPESTKWSVQIVRGILMNHAYMGRKDYGTHRQGKLHQVTDDGEIGAPTSRQPRKVAPIQVDAAHMGLVSAELFERVQERIQERAVKRSKPRTDGFLLSGLLFCGHCGHKMFGHGRNNKKRQHLAYICSGSSSKGVCEHRRISAHVIEDFVIDLLRQNVLSPEAIARLRKQIEKRLAERGRQQPDRAKALTSQVGELDKKIKRGTANLIEADPRHVRDMSDMLNDLRTQRAGLQAELDGLSVAKASRATVEAAVANLERLAAILKSRTNRPKVRELLHSLIERIDLWFRREGKRMRLAKGNCILIGPGTNASNDKIGSPMLQAPVPGLFPQRNRIISGLSLGVVVIEAGRNSGALHTARHAMEQNRDLFAVPGRIDSEASQGCLDLLRDGAILIRGVEDVLEALGPLTKPVKASSTETVHQPRELQLSDQERAVLNNITAEPVSIDEVLRSLTLESSRVLATLTVLEMRKLIRRLPGGFLIRL